MPGTRTNIACIISIRIMLKYGTYGMPDIIQNKGIIMNGEIKKRSEDKTTEARTDLKTSNENFIPI